MAWSIASACQISMGLKMGISWASDEAVYTFTMAGAFASFEEDIKGSIEEGKMADMVVLSENIFDISEEKIKDVKVDMTIFNGKVVYERN